MAPLPTAVPTRLRAARALLSQGALAAALSLGLAVGGGGASAADADAPASSSATSAAVPGVDPATVRAANLAAAPYLASQPHGPSASDAGERTIAGIEAELLILRGLLADQRTDAASTHYLAASKLLGTVNAADRQALGPRFRRVQDALATVAQALLRSSAVDPASHPAVPTPPPATTVSAAPTPAPSATSNPPPAEPPAK